MLRRLAAGAPGINGTCPCGSGKKFQEMVRKGLSGERRER